MADVARPHAGPSLNDAWVAALDSFDRLDAAGQREVLAQLGVWTPDAVYALGDAGIARFAAAVAGHRTPVAAPSYPAARPAACPMRRPTAPAGLALGGYQMPETQPPMSPFTRPAGDMVFTPDDSINNEPPELAQPDCISYGGTWANGRCTGAGTTIVDHQAHQRADVVATVLHTQGAAMSTTQRVALAVGGGVVLAGVAYLLTRPPQRQGRRGSAE